MVQSYDNSVKTYMQQNGFVGGSIAVVKNGRLVLARGYGLADSAGQQIAHPHHLFRIASLSKGITGEAVLVALQNKILSSLDVSAFGILGQQPNPVTANPTPTQQNPIPPQLANITVRQLLNHAGGFSRECGCTISVPATAPPGAPAVPQPLNGTACGSTCDPMTAQLFTVEGLSGNSVPPTCKQIVQYMMTQPFTWIPGQVSDYSNFGYCVLQAVLEKLTGTDYATWVTTNVLKPAGVTGIIPGHTIDIADHEVTYYDPTTPPQRSIFDTVGLCQNAGQQNASGVCASVVYGGAGLTSTGDIEAALAQGGWLATAVELLRLEVALDGRSGGAAILTDASVGQLELFPNLWTFPTTVDSGLFTLSTPNAGNWYGFGTGVNPNEDWFNNGGLNGTTTTVYRGGNNPGADSTAGFGWSAFFNTSNPPPPAPTDGGAQIVTDPGTMMGNAFNAAGGPNANWLAVDLFDQYGAYTPWMTSDQYQAFFDAQVAGGLYPSRVEGTSQTATPMFRAVFAPFKGAGWQSNHGMDCLTYQQRATAFAAQGYQTASLQAFVGSDGLRRYQATWVNWSACSPTCNDGSACTSNGDCASSICTGGVCQPPKCAPTCGQGQGCGAGSDCASGVCFAGQCQAPVCSGTCVNGSGCNNGGDCASRNCLNGKCQSPDCGANKCNQGAPCGANSDCGANLCLQGLCAAPPCSPAANLGGTGCPNQSPCNNSGDCGSKNCPNNVFACQSPLSCQVPCGPGNPCGANSDCKSNLCQANWTCR